MISKSCLISTAGSTDCVCYATVGVIDPVTSALHVIIGEAVFPLHITMNEM